MISKHTVNDIISLNLNINEVIDLLFESLEKLLIRGKTFYISSLRTKLFAGKCIDTIVQCQFKHLWDVKIATQNIGFRSKSTRFNTSTATTITGIYHALALTHQLLNNGIGIKDRGLSKSGLYNTKGTMNKTI